MAKMTQKHMNDMMEKTCGVLRKEDLGVDTVLSKKVLDRIHMLIDDKDERYIRKGVTGILHDLEEDGFDEDDIQRYLYHIIDMTIM